MFRGQTNVAFTNDLYATIDLRVAAILTSSIDFHSRPRPRSYTLRRRGRTGLYTPFLRTRSRGTNAYGSTFFFFAAPFTCTDDADDRHNSRANWRHRPTGTRRRDRIISNGLNAPINAAFDENDSQSRCITWTSARVLYAYLNAHRTRLRASERGRWGERCEWPSVCTS